MFLLASVLRSKRIWLLLFKSDSPQFQSLNFPGLACYSFSSPGRGFIVCYGGLKEFLKCQNCDPKRMEYLSKHQRWLARVILYGSNKDRYLCGESKSNILANGFEMASSHSSDD